jgi:hypothetical protein
MGISTLSPLSPFAIDIPPYNTFVAIGDRGSPNYQLVVSGSVAAYTDASVTTAVTTIVNKLATFAGDPSVGQLAEVTARIFAGIVRSLSMLGV